MIWLLFTLLAVAAVCAAAQYLALPRLQPQAAISRMSCLRHSAACLLCALLAQCCVLNSFTAAFSGWRAALIAAATAALYWVCVLAHAFARGKAPRVQTTVALSVFLACALFAECFFYNAKAFSTALYTGAPAGTVFVDETTDSDARITQLRYETIGGDVKNLQLTVGAVRAERKLESLTQPITFTPEELSGNPVTVRIYAVDASNSQELPLAERTIVYDVPATHTLTLYLAPPVKSLRIELDAPWYHSSVLLAQAMNVRIPMNFLPVRVLLLFALASLVWLLRPRSFVYGAALDFKNKRQCTWLAVAALLCVGLLWGIALLNRGFYVNPQPQDAQYQELARSLAAGKLSIGEAPAYLTQMENPYDTAARDTLGAVHAPGEHVGYRFDVAYYAGKYYVYFGVVPVLLFYLPFYLLTSRDMPNILATLVLLPFWVGGVWALLSVVARRKFARVSAALFGCICTMVTLCSGAVFLAKRPDFYSLPILTALVFTVWGLFFWVAALDSQAAHGSLHKGLLLAGSLCMALVAGCRPQMLLFSALAIPLFWDSVFRDRSLLSVKKNAVGNTLCLALPFAAVAAGLMAYNLLRFGSPFEFGAQYNLTVADMTQRGFVFARTGSGLFQYLLQPPVITAVFPFVQPVDNTLLYLGYVFNDPPFGGLLLCNPFLWTLLLLPICRSALRARKLWGFTLTGLGAALAVVVANIQMGGVLQRYFSDFGVVAFLLAALVALTAADEAAAHGVPAAHTLRSTTHPNSGYALRAVLLGLIAASLVYSVLTVFMGSTQALLSMDPARFYAAQHAICFWL